MLTFGSLFTGIGGIDLGLERAGMRCAWQCEIDDFRASVLRERWPDVTLYRDVREMPAAALPAVEVLCGGFPCADISHASQTKTGLDGDRSGLWSEMLRVLRGVRPRYLLVENVAAIAFRGLGRVLGDLAESGYDAEWDCLPASAFGAPHVRDRLFIVAYPDGERRPRGAGRGPRILGPEWGPQPADGPQGTRRAWPGEPAVARVAHGVPSRVDRAEALGRAVVPDVAEYVGRRILMAEAA